MHLNAERILSVHWIRYINTLCINLEDNIFIIFE